MNQINIHSIHTIVLFISAVQLWWLITAGVIVVSGAGCLFLNIRIRKLKHEKAVLVQRFEECDELRNYSKENENKAKEEAEFAANSKNELLRKISHEIHTPMNGVIGLASLLLETPLNSEQQEHLKLICMSAEKLMNVIDDMLITDMIDYSQSGQGMTELDNREFDLSNVIEEVFETFAFTAGQTGLELVYRTDENVPNKLLGDESKVKQILMKLTESAVFSSLSGEVFIGVKLIKAVEGNQVDLSFEVKNTDEEPDDKETKSIAGNSLKAEKKNKDDEMGLNICKKLISLMGGNLEAEKKYGKNPGTVFRFKLRLRPCLQPQRSNYGFIQNMEWKKALIVDDNFTSRDTLKKQLEQWNLSVITAESGESALDILSKKAGFDLIITDLKMPGINGIELSEKIRAANISTPLILLNLPGDELYKKYPGLFADVITKPVKQQLLFNSIYTKLSSPESFQSALQEGIQKPSGDFAKQYPLHILVAEDNKKNQKIILSMLKDLGYDADLVNNGKEALEIVGETDYDLILMDEQMPAMNGFEASRMIRLCLRTQPVIIGMTTDETWINRQECLQSGMDDNITKPIKTDDLIKTLQKWAIQTQNKIEK